MSGYIKLRRKLLKHWISAEPESFAIWSRLLLEANFKAHKEMKDGQLVSVGRGQLIYGVHAFAKRSGVSASKLRRIIKILETELMIDKQSFSKYSIITIVNYEEHQGSDKQETTEEQSGDQQTTTLEEGKELKKVKKSIKRSSQIDPNWKASDELAKGIAQNEKVTVDAVKNQIYSFVNYWVGEGKPKKDWNATFRQWCRNDYGGSLKGNKSKQGSLLSENPTDWENQKIGKDHVFR